MSASFLILNPYRPFCGPEQDVGTAALDLIRQSLAHPASGSESIGAILVEPIQGRGGEIVPPPAFLSGLREIANEFGLVLIFDEIFTGFGRTGRMFACEWDGVVPDILCVGKALGGGVPLSAAIGTPDVMGPGGSQVARQFTRLRSSGIRWAVRWVGGP